MNPGFMSIILTFLPIHQMTLNLFSLSKVRQEKKEKNLHYLFKFVMNSPVEIADRQTAKSKVGTETEGRGQEIRKILVWHNIALLIRL